MADPIERDHTMSRLVDQIPEPVLALIGLAVIIGFGVAMELVALLVDRWPWAGVGLLAGVLSVSFWWVRRPRS